MSLTRDQWVEMWKSVKVIEANNKPTRYPDKSLIIHREIKKIKKLIESIIGQME